MNPREKKLRSLLDDVLPLSADDCGPDQARILAMARHERNRRRQSRIVLGSAAALAVIALITSLGVRPRPSVAPPSTVSAPNPAHVVIQAVYDDQLFAILQSTPSAIMEWPNGDRALLVVTE